MSKHTHNDDGSLTMSLTAEDTEEWACRPGEAWPDSSASGKSITATIDMKGNLVDLVVSGDGVIRGHELTAILSDCEQGNI